MSAVTAHSAPFSLLHMVRDSLANLFHRPAQVANSTEDLRSLPNHVLLDIGIDPRTVETGPTVLIGAIDTVTGRHLTVSTRTFAKS